jgi:hypothetical protein
MKRASDELKFLFLIKLSIALEKLENFYNEGNRKVSQEQAAN